MEHDKKTYVAPELIAHGDVESLTKQGGGGIADAPIGIGTPIGPGNTGTSA
jgi:hypothetical protein